MWNKIKYFFINLFVSFGNLYRYFSVVWNDRQYDYSYILNLLELKLRLTAAAERKHGQFESSARTAEKIEMCVRLIKKLNDDYYGMEWSNYRVAYFLTSKSLDCEGCSEISVVETSNDYTNYFKKHKSAYNKMIKKLGEDMDETAVALLIGAEREKKAKEILFNTMRDNITSWWM